MSYVDTLKEIRKEVLKQYLYIPDAEQFGKPDYWQSVSEIRDMLKKDLLVTDDCDGSAYFHMLKCIEAGLDMKYGWLATVNVQSPGRGFDHLIAGYGNWIMDNNYVEIQSPIFYPYKIFTVHECYHPGWFKVKRFKGIKVPE